MQPHAMNQHIRVGKQGRSSFQRESVREKVKGKLVVGEGKLMTILSLLSNKLPKNNLNPKAYISMR